MTFQHDVACVLYAAEDQTKAADQERLRWPVGIPWRYLVDDGGTTKVITRTVPGIRRPATPAERQLLQHLGHTPPEVLDTLCRGRGGGIVARSWTFCEAPDG